DGENRADTGPRTSCHGVVGSADVVHWRRPQLGRITPDEDPGESAVTAVSKVHIGQSLADRVDTHHVAISTVDVVEGDGGRRCAPIESSVLSYDHSVAVGERVHDSCPYTAACDTAADDQRVRLELSQIGREHRAEEGTGHRLLDDYVLPTRRDRRDDLIIVWATAFTFARPLVAPAAQLQLCRRAAFVAAGICDRKGRGT